MIRALIGFSIRNRLLVLLAVLGLVMWGIYSLMRLPIDAVPDITNNQVQIVTVSNALGPQEVEQLITLPIELQMGNLPDVEEIRSISRYGLSIITVVFRDEVPLFLARQWVTEQLQRAKVDAKLGVPELMPVTTGLGEIYQYSLEVEAGYQHQYDLMELREIQDWIVKRALSGIPGVIEIGSFGGFVRQYEVAAQPEKLRAFSVTILDLHQALSAANENTGSAYIEKGPYAYYIRGEGRFQDLEEIEKVPVLTRNGLTIRVGDLAQVAYGHAPRYGAMTKDGKGEAVGGIAYMLKGANSIETVNRVKERVAEVNKTLPEGIQIQPYLERSALVYRAIATVRNNLLEGGLIVIFVLVLFLGHYRAGLIAASVIPLSLLFALGMMNLTGVSANLMSLGAIDFGVIIDCAVIVVESTVYVLTAQFAGKKLSQKEMDETVEKASFSVIKSAAFGVLVILVVFFPLITLEGIEGKMFRPMAQTFSFALIGALLLSLTYVPMMLAWFAPKEIKDHDPSQNRLSFIIRPLNRTLSLGFQRPLIFIGSAVILFVLALFGLLRLGGEFLPQLEEGDLAMQITIPSGSSLQQSVDVSTAAEKILMEQFPEVKQAISKIGTAEVPTDPMAIEEADVMIILKEKKDWVTASTTQDLVAKMKLALEEIPGVEFDFTQPIQLRFNELMTGVKADLALKIFGEDLHTLAVKAEELAAIVATVPGAADIKIEQTEGMRQYLISYDREALAKYNIRLTDANRVIESSVAGLELGLIYEGERSFSLMLRMSDTHREGMQLQDFLIANPEGLIIPMSQIARLELVEGPLQISRENTRRRISIGVNVRGRDIKSLVEEIKLKLDEDLDLPAGYYVSIGGQFENYESARKRLMMVVPVALLLIFLLLYLALGSTRHALVILSVVPMTIIGGVAALYLRDMPFSISAGVGFIALIGIAILNGLVLVSYMNELLKSGASSVSSAIHEAVKVRLRPVLMTAATDVLGFLPMALAASAGAEVQRPLATVVIGGVISSTLLTLLILPIIYYLIERRKS
jgi:cobalt-zinc-cadmium resistance protein CzcA